MIQAVEKPMNARERKRWKFHKDVEELMDQGVAVSAIAKKLGKSYIHTKRVHDWILESRDA